MYYLILFCTFYLYVTHAAVIPSESDATIVKYENSNDGAGNYKFSFETSNGIKRKEVGFLVNIGEENEHMLVTGSYSYIDVDGKRVTFKYVADDSGYFVIPKSKKSVNRIAPNVVATLLGR